MRLLRGRRYLAFTGIDSSQKRIYGYRKQSARVGVTKIASKQVAVRGLNAYSAMIRLTGRRPWETRDSGKAGR